MRTEVRCLRPLSHLSVSIAPGAIVDVNMGMGHEYDVTASWPARRGANAGFATGTVGRIIRLPKPDKPTPGRSSGAFAISEAPLCPPPSLRAPGRPLSRRGGLCRRPRSLALEIPSSWCSQRGSSRRLPGRPMPVWSAHAALVHRPSAAYDVINIGILRRQLAQKQSDYPLTMPVGIREEGGDYDTGIL
jgi:hypothetical protein